MDRFKSAVKEKKKKYEKEKQYLYGKSKDIRNSYIGFKFLVLACS